LGLSWKNYYELHQIVDCIPTRAPWKKTTLRMSDGLDDVHVIYYRDALDCIRTLWANPAFADKMVFAPERVFVRDPNNPEAQCRVYNEMWTGDWWWNLQELFPTDTIVPIILASDKTKLTKLSGGKLAYPVYLTIGNIPKAIRRKPSMHACTLVAYLSTEKIALTNVKNAHAASSARMDQLFHESFRIIMQSVVELGRNGLEMTGGDGAVRFLRPIVACYAADYPEQCLLTLCRQPTCAKCDRILSDISKPGIGNPRTHEQVLENLRYLVALERTCTAADFVEECREMCLRPTVENPFWKDLPYCNIFSAMSSDFLHQLQSGIFGHHLVKWCQTKEAVMSKNGLDSFLRVFPTATGVRCFQKGFSILSQITGSEYMEMACVFLGALVLAPAENGFIRAARAFLDFMYLAQYETHTTNTLHQLASALKSWHAHRDIFISSDAYPQKDFSRIPKMHSMEHYDECIHLFGTTDNYNSGVFERLHIDYAKRAWEASNKRDAMPQMIIWLERLEKVNAFETFLSWRQKAMASRSTHDRHVSRRSRVYHIAQVAPQCHQEIQCVAIRNGAPHLSSEIERFLLSNCHPSKKSLIISMIDKSSRGFEVEQIDVWTLAKIIHQPISGVDPHNEIRDAFHAKTGRFDFVFVRVDGGVTSHNLCFSSLRVGQARVIFKLPRRFLLADPSLPSGPLVYLHWFSKFGPNSLEKASKMHRIRRSWRGHPSHRVSLPSITCLAHVLHSVHLFPDINIREIRELGLTRHNIVDKVDTFFVNPWVNTFIYHLLTNLQAVGHHWLLFHLALNVGC
jgi:hypothetical protein